MMSFEFVFFFPFSPSFVADYLLPATLSLSLSVMLSFSSTILLCPLVSVRCSFLTYHDR